MSDILNTSTLEEDLNYTSENSDETALSLYTRFMSSSTLDEMYYTNMLPSINSDNISLMMQFTNEQIVSLSEKANVLYASIQNPTEDDRITLEDLIDTLNLLENGGNAEIMPLLESGTYTWNGGTQAAQTISGNVTINASGTITITGKIIIAQNAVVTIQGSCTFLRDTSFTSNLFDIYDDGTLNVKGASESSRIIIDGQNIDSITVIRNDQNLYMENVTIRNNNNTLHYRGMVTDEEAGTTDETDTGSNSKDTSAAGAITIIQSSTGSSTSSTGSTVLKNCIIENCKSKEGGGLYLVRNGGGTVDLINTTIKNCSATGRGGGGIFVDGKPKTDEALTNPANYTINITNSVIDGCTGGNGSAILMAMQGTAKIVMTGSTIQNNASSGSGSYGTIRSDGNGNYQLTIDNCIIQNNTSSGAGGGIYWNASGANSVLQIKGNTQIINNTAKSNGGGLFVEGALMEIQDTIISGNTAQLGAGICVKTFADSSFKGQGLWTANDSFNLYLYENTTISNNIASQKGGGLAFYIVDAIDIVEDGYTFNFINDGAVFSNNIVTSDGENIDGVGGAIAMIKATSTNNYNVNTTIKSGSLINNCAYDGGAVHITIGNLQMSGGTIEDHTVSGNGAGIYVTGGNFIMTSGVFSNNTSQSSGGAIYVADGDVTVESGTITNNIALNKGGAIAVTGGDLTIGTQECHDAGESSTHVHPVIEGNIASDGGGIYVDGGVTTMWCGDIKQNLTYDQTVNVLVISGGNFVYNGGTIGIPYDSGVFVNGGVFEDNSSESGETIKHELYYHSVLGNEVHNGRIPESKWIASPRGDVLNIDDCNDISPTWGDLFPEYEFVGWENKPETDTDEIVNLYAIWEKK